MMRTGHVAWIVLLLMWPAMATADSPVRTEVLTVALGGNPSDTEPGKHMNGAAKLVVQHVAESLVGHRKDMSVAPVLADTVEVSEDHRTYTFRLRDGIRFHNGEPLGAEDVAWVWRDYYLNPATHWECRPYFDGSGSIEERTNGAHVLEVEATAPDTVVFRLAEPSILFLPRMADVNCAPVVFHRDSVGAEGRWEKLIGTGPYQFVEWKRDEVVRLRRNPDYVPRTEPRDGYAGARIAYAEHIELPIYSQRRAALDALRQGEIDAVLDIKEHERVQLEGEPGIRIVTTQTVSYWSLLIQTEDPLLSDLRIRRAIAHAIDAEYIAAVLTEGRQTANPSVILRDSIHDSSAQRRGHLFDPALARKLLAEAGYDGRSIELQANRDGYPEMYRIGVLVRSMLAAVGMDVVIRDMPWQEQLDTHYQQGTFQLQGFGQGGRNHPILAYGKFIGPKAEKARFQWDDAEAFGMLERAQRAPDEASLQAILDALHTGMIEQVPTIALLNFERHEAVRENVHGIETMPFLRTVLWGAWKE